MNNKDILLIALWKIEEIKSEIIENKNFNKIPKSILKVGLFLRSQKIEEKTKTELIEKNWLLIEVEDILQDANEKELERYFKSLMENDKRLMFEASLTKENEYVLHQFSFVKKEQKQNEESVDYFLSDN